MINEKILNYIIIRSIGKGGMAEVYEAQHETFAKRKVAIKILDPVLARNEKIAVRFVNEAKIMAELEHKNIVAVIDFEKRSDMLAIVMELLEGKSLTGYIKQKGKLQKDETLKIFKQALSAFEFAHKKGVVHRDVKPSNIFIETHKGNNVKILDFGIAKLLENDANSTNTGAQMGTPVYMSPEQVKDSKHIDQRSDIYSLGVVLYYMLAGKPPYDSTSLSNFDIYTKIVNEPVPELTVYPALNEIIKKATAKNADERYQTCNEFENALINNFGKISNFGKVETNTDDQTLIDNEEYTDDDATLVETDPETELWEQIKNKNDLQQFKNYLKKYPNGKYKQEASKKIGKLITKKNTNKLENNKIEVQKQNAFENNKLIKNDMLLKILTILSIIFITIHFISKIQLLFGSDTYNTSANYINSFSNILSLIYKGSALGFIFNFIFHLFSSFKNKERNNKIQKISFITLFLFLIIHFLNFSYRINFDTQILNGIYINDKLNYDIYSLVIYLFLFMHTYTIIYLLGIVSFGVYLNYFLMSAFYSFNLFTNKKKQLISKVSSYIMIISYSFIILYFTFF